MSVPELPPVDISPQLYRLQTQIDTLREAVDRQGRTIDALIATIPQMSQAGPPGTPGGGRRSSGGMVYREWVGWLSQNGPAFRQTIMDAVGKPLPGNQSVVNWNSIMATWADDAMPSDTLCKINGHSTGQGRPPVIYFLWSQRFDLHSKFGVGPESRPEPQGLLGVVHPPIVGTGSDEIARLPVGQDGEILNGGGRSGATVTEVSQEIEVPPANPQPTVEPEGPPRFATMEEWHERWDTVFDATVPYGEAPDRLEKEQMILTLPEDTDGEPPGTILARAAHEARQRAQNRPL
jgi:hypothetical protein